MPAWLKAYPKELPLLNPNPARVKTISVVCLFKMAHFGGASSARTAYFADGVCKILPGGKADPVLVQREMEKRRSPLV
jgi:hypothetical protein